MTKNKKYVFYIPEKLLQKVKEFKENNTNIPGFKISRLLYLVHLIISHKQETHPGSYAILKMEYLNNVVPFARLYLYLLRDEGIIEWKNHFNSDKPGVESHSRLYRLCKEYEGPTVCRTITDRKLAYKIEMQYLEVKKANSKKYPNLNKWVYKVEINEKKAKQTVNEVYQDNIRTGKINAEGIKTFALAEIEKIVRGEIYIRVSKTNGRYDSNFTRLPSYLVPFLTINNLQLIEIDIANSQPFFAGCLINPTEEIQLIMDNSLLMYEKTLYHNDKQDVNTFIQLVTSGEFYQYLMNEFDKNNIPYIDKDDFKKQLFTVFFGRNSAKYVCRSVKLFANLFPNIYGLFEFIKRDEHNQLAILLQKIESHVILNRVAPQIIAQFPEMPFITKHDSLLPVYKSGGFIVPDKNIESIKGLIISEVKKVTGLTPFVRVKKSCFEANTLKPSLLSQNSPNPIYYTIICEKPL